MHSPILSQMKLEGNQGIREEQERELRKARFRFSEKTQLKLWAMAITRAKR
jgi:hypothetical protein